MEYLIDTILTLALFLFGLVVVLVACLVSARRAAARRAIQYAERRAIEDGFLARGIDYTFKE